MYDRDVYTKSVKWTKRFSTRKARFSMKRKLYKMLVNVIRVVYKHEIRFISKAQ